MFRRQRMHIGFTLVCGHKPHNFKDLTGQTFGALHCDEESQIMDSNKRWGTTCLCCNHKKPYLTQKMKQGRCSNCGATAAPNQNQVA